MSLQSLLHLRLTCAALFSSATGGLLLLALSLFEPPDLCAALGAALLLPIAQLISLAAVARARAPVLRGRQLLLELVSCMLTAVSCCLFAASLGESETWAMGLVLAIAAQLRQPGRYGLSWDYFPQEAIHRKVKQRLPWMFLSSFGLTLLCMLFAGPSGSFGSWLCTGVVVLSSLELQEMLLQGATSNLRAEGYEVLEALLEPNLNGLSRWLALTTLAHAVAYRHQGQSLSTTAFGYPVDIPPPAYAAQVFGFGGKSFSGLQAADGRSFFAVYLQSSLEVLREFTIRVQCLVASSRRKGVKALSLAQLQVLELQMLDLAPLMRIAACGLSGWICLSRDLDSMGKVQREEALGKVIHELCGSSQALQGLLSLRGILDLAAQSMRCARSCYEEAQHSLFQLIITFEHCGLKQVVLPPFYKRMLEDATQPP